MKKLRRDVLSFTTAGVGLGIGAGISGAASSAAGVPNYAGPAFSSVGEMMAPVGTVMMGGHTLRLINKGFMPKRYKTNRRYRI